MWTELAQSTSVRQMADQKPFNVKLREWRFARGLLQKQAADFLKVPLDTFRQWEYGNNTPHQSPSMDEILKRMEVEQ